MCQQFSLSSGLFEVFLQSFWLEIIIHLSLITHVSVPQMGVTDIFLWIMTSTRPKVHKKVMGAPNCSQLTFSELETLSSMVLF